MSYDPGGSPLDPHFAGATVAILALAAFLVFREVTADPLQQAGMREASAASHLAAPPGRVLPPLPGL